MNRQGGFESPPGHQNQRPHTCGLWYWWSGVGTRNEGAMRPNKGSTERSGDGQCKALGQRPERSESIPSGHQGVDSQRVVKKVSGGDNP